MNYDKIFGFCESTNGYNQTAYYIYSPKKPTKAVVQISHGMNEYIERYENFIEFLCSNGIAVIGNDHLGHGDTVFDKDDYGYFSSENGWIYLVKDLYTITKIAKEQFPDTPIFLLGHSMGSLIVRTYLTKYTDQIKGAILLGTTAPNKFTDAGIILAKYLCKHKGDKYRPNYLQRILLEIGNIKIKAKRTDFDWVSSDPNAISSFLKCEKCNFIFTCRAYLDILYLQSYVCQKSWVSKIPHDIPFLILSGTDDPVGNYGKGPKALFNTLVMANIQDVSLKLYQGKRHELLNETEKQKIYDDILLWIKEKQ